MAIKKTDIGKKIEILNTNKANYLNIGGVYTIKFINEDGSVILSGTAFGWYGTENEHFKFMVHANNDMEIGDIVIIAEKTTTLREGEEKKIIGFLCDDRNKIILEGIIPGGWVEPRKVTKKIDISNLRVKKAIELFSDRGPMFYTNMFISTSMKEALGKSFTELNVKQFGKRLITNYGNGLILTPDMFTDSKYEDLEIVITSNSSDIGYVRTNVRSDKTQVLGKKLSSLRKNFNPQNDEDICKLSVEFSNNGEYIKIQEFAITGKSLKIIKSSEYEAQTPVTVSNPL